MPHDTIPLRLQERARLAPRSAAYYQKQDGFWVGTSYEQYAIEVRRVGRALIALGVPAGGTVCILGFNRPEWITMDVAAMSIGAAPAGIYTTCSPAEVRYIVHHAEAKVVLVENAEQWAKVKKERENLPLLRHVVTMRGCPEIDDPMVLSWDALLSKGDLATDAQFYERLHALEPSGLATLIYTSGTTGPPKGVMLTHRNLVWTADCSEKMTSTTEDDCSLSYLPLSHIAEQMFSIHGPISRGLSVYFAESIEKVADNLKEVRPTVFFGVPRIWEKMYAGISGRLAEATGAKAKIAAWARSVGTRASAYKMAAQPVPRALELELRLAKRLVFDKVKAAIGFDRVRIAVSGAAPVAKEVLEFFASFDLVIHEVYGQSEDTGPTTFNRPGAVKLGTVGTPIPDIEVRLGDDGEILVRGPHVFAGYYKEPAATAETLKDGWLCSGDLGAFDAQGFLTITGRKKEIIITAGGKNITPKNIEAALKNHPLINEAVVIGDRRKFLSVLVTLDPEVLVKRGIDAATAHENAQVRAEVQKAIDEVNLELARVEQIKKFTILTRNLTLEHGELTPTLKVKRRVVNEHFKDQIESMYADARE